MTGTTQSRSGAERASRARNGRGSLGIEAKLYYLIVILGNILSKVN